MLADHSSAIRCKLRKLGIRRAWLDDLTQSVLLTAVRKGAPRDPREERRFLLEIARKHAANWRRLHCHLYKTVSLEALKDEPIDETTDIELQMLVREGLGRLSPEEREWVEAFGAGESLREIGRERGIPKSTVQVHSAQARMRAREELGGLLPSRG
jgi:RNA polymerase sigma factor (sigma-70 family)